MIDLYTWTTPNGRKVSILLEEVGLPYAPHPVDIVGDGRFDPDFLKINPNNKIPAISRPQDRPADASRAGDYSIADIALWPWIARFDWHGIDLNAYPNIRRWYLAIADRPAVRRGYHVPCRAEDIPMP